MHADTAASTNTEKTCLHPTSTESSDGSDCCCAIKINIEVDCGSPEVGRKRHPSTTATVRGALSTTVSDCSSLAGVHKWSKLELVHMEVEAEGQESEVEDKKDGEECEVDVYQNNDDTMRMTHAMMCAQHLELEPMSM